MEMVDVCHVSHFVLGEEERKSSICNYPLRGAECACDLCQFRHQNFDGDQGRMSHHFVEGGFTKGCYQHRGD